MSTDVVSSAVTAPLHFTGDNLDHAFVALLRKVGLGLGHAVEVLGGTSGHLGRVGVIFVLWITAPQFFIGTTWDLLFRCGHVFVQLVQLVSDPVFRCSNRQQRNVFGLQTAVRVLRIALDQCPLPVGEDVVDANEVFSDLRRVEPTIQRALQGMLVVTGAAGPDERRGGLVIVDDAVGNKVELSANGETTKRTNCTLLQIDRDGVFDCSQFFISGVDQHTVDDILWNAQLGQVLAVALDPRFFDGVVQRMSQCSGDVFGDVRQHTFCCGDTAGQDDLTKWLHQAGGTDVVGFVDVVVLVVCEPDCEGQADVRFVCEKHGTGRSL